MNITTYNDAQHDDHEILTEGECFGKVDHLTITYLVLLLALINTFLTF